MAAEVNGLADGGAAGAARTGLRRFFRSEEIGVITGLLAIGLVMALTTDSFLQASNLLQVTRQASYYGIMAVGMVFVLSMGDVDLSVGSIFTLVNIVTAICLRERYGVPVAISAGLLCGAMCGLLNGVLSVVLRIPMIIVTLGTLSVYRGLALVASSASPISQFSKETAFITIGGGRVLGIPTSAVVMVVIGIVGYVLFNQTPFGWRVQAIGSSAQAARYSGIPISYHRIAVMTLMGGISALAGIMALAFLESADPSSGQGFELRVIASAIIGGTTLSGGSGSIPGAILGALMIALIANGLALHEVNAYWSTAITGVVIIVAVAVGALVKRKS